MHEDDSLVKVVGSQPGPTLAVFCGVHGNERVGIDAVNEVMKKVTIESGTVYFVYANPRAIEQNVRFTERNLNRCFFPTNTGSTYEDVRARELMKLLDSVDVLLDVHASNTPDATPFAICEDAASDFVKCLDFEITSSGWDAIEPGATDGYMLSLGKPGITLECGYVGDGSKYGRLAEDSILKFLTFFGAISGKIEPASRAQRNLKVHKAIIKEDESFEFSRQYQDFESLPAGTCFAKDKHRSYCVEQDSVILFATNKPVGHEVAILGGWE